MNTADPFLAHVVMQQLVWFVFHFTGAAVPAPLRKLLVNANAAFKKRALRKQRGWQWEREIPAQIRDMVSYDLIGASDDLTWLCLTDGHLKQFLDRETTQKYSTLEGDMLHGFLARLLSTVRCTPFALCALHC